MIKYIFILAGTFIASWSIYKTYNYANLSTEFLVGETRLLVPNIYFNAAQMNRWKRLDKKASPQGMDSVGPKLALRMPVSKFVADTGLKFDFSKHYVPSIKITVWNKEDNSEVLTDAKLDILLRRGRFEKYLINTTESGKYTKLTHPKDKFDVKYIESKLLNYNENQLKSEFRSKDIFIGNCRAFIRRLSGSVCGFSLWDDDFVYDISVDAALIEERNRLSEYIIDLFDEFKAY